MVTRLELTPENGLLMSRPGVDVTQGDTHRLMDPRFPSLEVHAMGGGQLQVEGEGNQTDDVSRTWTFPDLGYVPIAFVQARYPSEGNIIKYPATLTARTTYNTDIGNITVYNFFEVTSNSIYVRCTIPANAPIPIARWMIMRNPRVMNQVA